MSIRNKHDEIWIALANIQIDQVRSSITDANYAYVTVLGLAKGESNFMQKVSEMLSLQHFKLLRLEEVERLSERIAKFELESSILALAEDIINGHAEVQFSTFHTYD
jgi:hypothetical protein